jgi:SSS family solute:Na+ symporter
MSHYDYAVIAIYLCFIACLGPVFSKFSKNSSDFFRGGGNMLWWMAGSMAFMSQFSSWTFTGAASSAYVDGPLVLVIYFGNGLGCFLGYLWTAGKFRQMRVVTPMEGIRDRFGKFNEQFFTWVWIPIGIVYAAIWLNAVSTFVSIVFGMNMTLTIVVVGLVVLIVACFGGAWAVVASAFLQMLLLMALTLVAAVLSIYAVGDKFGGGGFLHGVTAFVNHFPSHYTNLSETHRLPIVVFWIMAFLLKQVCTTNNMKDADRFLSAKDTRNASQASLLAGVLFMIGPIIWFIPPMAAAILYPDLSVIPQLHGLKTISEGAYVAIGLKCMPVGMIGLMMSAIFASTMATMDTGLNKNAGIFVRNFYMPVLRKHAKETEYMIVSKVASFVFGMLIILAAYIIAKIPNVGIFNVMNVFSAMVALPFIMPLIWCIVIKRTPSWAGWSTVCVGFMASILFYNYVDPETFRKLLGLHIQVSPDVMAARMSLMARLVGLHSPIRPGELDNYKVIGGTIVSVVSCSLWFVGTALFARFNSPAYNKQEEEFFERLHTPVTSDPAQAKLMDMAQLQTLSKLCLPYGGFIMLLAAIPNPLGGRLSFIFSGGMIVGIGLLLRWKANRLARLYKPMAPAPSGQNVVAGK